MKLPIDMNLSPHWVVFFQKEGIQAAHWSSLGAPIAPDSEIMDFAVSYGYVILTQDLDFGIMLASNERIGPSVVQLRAAEITPSVIGHFVVRALRQTSSELENGALVTIDPRRARIRLLPLRSSPEALPEKD